VSGATTLTSGFHKGRDSPFDRWVQGERSLPRVVDRRYGLLALKWGQSPARAKAGGMQRERAAGSLAKIAV